MPLLEVHDSLPSSNDRCRALAEEGAPLFTTVIAEAQTAGRGRGGHTWSSPQGLGLWMTTLVARPGQAPSPLAPLLIGLAVIRGIVDVVPGLSPGLKWPNDVWIGDRKVGGILCESAGTHGTVAGIGINVAQRPNDFEPDLRGAAVSLAMASGGPVSRPALAAAVLRNVQVLMRDPPTRLVGPLADSVAAVDLLEGRPVVVSTGQRGRAVGIGSDGSLRVQERDGTVLGIHAGSVRPQDAVRLGSAGPKNERSGV